MMFTSTCMSFDRAHIPDTPHCPVFYWSEIRLLPMRGLQEINSVPHDHRKFAGWCWLQLLCLSN